MITKKMAIEGNQNYVDLVVESIKAADGKDLEIFNSTGKDVIITFTDAAGERKLLFVDSGAQTVASIDSNGKITASGGFEGALTGAVTGNVTGNVTGDLTGNSTGSHSGDIVSNAPAAINFAGGHADKTLSATEKKVAILLVTNADAAANIVAPAENRVYIIINTSGQAITIKKSGGTGFAVANNKTAIAAYNGTDYVRITADV